MGYKFLLMGTLRFFFNEIICKFIFYAGSGTQCVNKLELPLQVKKKSFIKNLL